MYLYSEYLYYQYLIYNNTSQSKLNFIFVVGMGYNFSPAQKKGAKLVAIDYAEYVIILCKKSVQKYLKLNGDFKVLVIQHLKDYGTEEFDIVTCAGSLSYLDNSLLFK